MARTGNTDHPCLAGRLTRQAADSAAQPEDERDALFNLEPESTDEGPRLVEALSDGVTDVSMFSKRFGGDDWGVLLDRYGIRRMLNVPDPEAA